jgi:hypothetical protein
MSESEEEEDEEAEEDSDKSSERSEDKIGWKKKLEKLEQEYEERKVASKYFGNIRNKLFVTLGAKRARTIVPTVVLNRSRLLSKQKKAIFIHHCDKCKKRQLDRTTELVFKTNIDDIYFLQIELCDSCMDSNFKLSEQYKRLFGLQNTQKNKYLIQ